MSNHIFPKLQRIEKVATRIMALYSYTASQSIISKFCYLPYIVMNYMGTQHH